MANQSFRSRTVLCGSWLFYPIVSRPRYRSSFRAKMNWNLWTWTPVWWVHEILLTKPTRKKSHPWSRWLCTSLKSSPSMNFRSEGLFPTKKLQCKFMKACSWMLPLLCKFRLGMTLNFYSFLKKSWYSLWAYPNLTFPAFFQSKLHFRL